MRCEPRATETAGATGRETLKLSPWGTKVVSLHGQSRQVRRAEAEQPVAERTKNEDGDAPGGPQAGHTGDSRQETRHGEKAPSGG